jgi:exonuclease III
MNGTYAHFISLNVRGLRSREKRQIIYNWIKNQKANICFLQETYLDQEIEKIVKNEWKGEIINSFGTTHSRGVLILFNEHLDVKVEKTHIAEDGRRILVNLTINDKPLTLVNIYAPTIHKVKEDFFKKTYHWIKRNAKYEIIIGGDFNCVQDKHKDTQNVKGKCIKPKHLQKIMKHFHLVDIWRRKWPEKRQYTWRQISLGISSRIDYWLVKQDLQNFVESTDIRPSIKSDHNAISLKLRTGKQKNGPSFWKFNASLTTDNNYREQIRDVIHNCIDDCNSQVLSKQITWELCKTEIKCFTISYCKEKSKNKNKEINQLQNDVQTLEHQMECNPTRFKNEYVEAKSKLEKMYKDITKGAIIRSRVKWHEDGETNSKYCLGLEKQRGEKGSILELKTKRGKTVTKLDDVLNETVDYYHELYTSKNVSSDVINSYVNRTNVKHVSEDDANVCEGLISIDECTKAVHKLKLNKSPGSDGLTPEFYKTFWEDIKEIVTDSLNEGFDKGEFSFSQKRGIIKLLYKKGDRNNLDNYRPISLLNYDYKICTLALAMRLQNIIGNIISEDQTGYIKGRFIGQNIRLIEDIIDYYTDNEKDGAILFVDFQKAFDSLEINFLISCLEKIGFGVQFISWVKTLYNNINSCISLNGWISKSFGLGRGIRQGCPLSALLFIIAAEFMSTNIRDADNINGIQFKSDAKLEVRITQLADDTTIFVNDVNSVANVIRIIKQFSNVSGVVMNLNKSEGMWLGKTKPVNLNKEIRWTDNPVKCLGIYFSKDKQVAEDLNWKPKIVKIDKLLNGWKARKLTYFGKITIIKTLGISQILYNANSLHVPNYVIKAINTRIFRYLWGSNCEKVKRETITGYMEYGGLKMPNLEYQLLALKIKWISRLCEQNNDTVWKRVVKQWFDPFGGLPFLLELNCKSEDVCDITKGKIPSFYQNLLESWYFLQNKCNKITPNNTMLWGNDNVRVDGRVLFFPKWIHAHIYYLNDIVIENRFVNLREFEDILKCPHNLFNLYKLITSIPKRWKVKVREGDLSWCEKSKNTFFEVISGKVVHVSMLSSKHIYHMLNQDNHTPICINYWEQTFHTRKDWYNIFLFKLKNRILNKIGHFQFNLIYNLIPCKKNLHKWKLIESDKCDFCDNLDDYRHFFVSCVKNISFWNRITTCLNTLKYFSFRISLEQVICGWKIENPEFDIANIIIILACYSIYKFRMIYNETKKEIPMFHLFNLEIIKLNDLLSNSKKRQTITITKSKKWKNLKTYLNVI